jgi:hypothetical protein
VAAVVVSAAIAWREGHLTRHHGLAMGFLDHGGMWSDLVLLSMANAVIVPHLTFGRWIPFALLVATVASVWVHLHWYHPPASINSSDDMGLEQGRVSPTPGFGESGDHMWPSHTQGLWWRDLAWAGWAHVVYVIGELTLLIGFLLHPAPEDVVLLVAAIFTIHVPIGLLQPRWFRTGHIATVQEQPLLAPLLLTLWAVTMIKL